MTSAWEQLCRVFALISSISSATSSSALSAGDPDKYNRFIKNLCFSTCVSQKNYVIPGLRDAETLGF